MGWKGKKKRREIDSDTTERNTWCKILLQATRVVKTLLPLGELEGPQSSSLKYLYYLFLCYPPLPFSLSTFLHFTACLSV